MKISIKSVLILGSILVIVLFFLSFQSMYQAHVNLVRNRQWVLHTHEVTAQLEKLLLALKNCEVGQREYLISGDTNYLQLYTKESTEIEESLNKLQVLVADNIDQQQRVQVLRKLVVANLSELHQTIELRRNRGFEAVRQIGRVDLDKKTMNSIDAVLASMSRAEEELLPLRVQHLNEVEARDVGVPYVFASLGFGFLLSTLALIIYLVRVKEREQTILTQSEQVNHEQEELFRLAISNVKNYAIFMLDPEGQVVTWNWGVKRIKGYEENEITGKHFSIFYTEEDRKAGKPELELKIAETEGSFEYTGWRVRKNGTRFWANVMITAIYDSNNKLRGFANVTHDITSQKEMERKVSEFYSMVSHELRTPLTSIRGSLCLMEGGRAGELPPRATHLVQIAYSESERLIRLVNDILDIRKIEAGKLELKFQELLPSEIVQEALASVESIASQAGIKLTPQINVANKFTCDRDRITQVLTNLLSNAIKFSPPREEVIVRVDSTPTSYRFSIIDKGPSIPKDQMHKLFGLFQQLDLLDDRQQGGTGLGLAISKAIVEEHQGKIGVNSGVGQGSIFWFELPINIHTATSATLGLVKSEIAKYTTLVVDSDEKLGNLLSMMLEEQGITVVRANSVGEAEVYLLQNENPDVIILDLGEPNVDGLELMNKLRHSEATESIPIVILSGREPERGISGDPLLVDWIKKSFDEQKLLTALRLAISKRTYGPGRILVIEDDPPVRESIKQDLKSLSVERIEAGYGELVRTSDPDLIVLDLVLPDLDSFEVVQILRRENLETIPVLVYTARDLSSGNKQSLTLGLTAHLIKTHTSEKELLKTLKQLVSGLVKEATLIKNQRSRR